MRDSNMLNFMYSFHYVGFYICTCQFHKNVDITVKKLNIEIDDFIVFFSFCNYYVF